MNSFELEKDDEDEKSDDFVNNFELVKSEVSVKLTDSENTAVFEKGDELENAVEAVKAYDNVKSDESVKWNDFVKRVDSLNFSEEEKSSESLK